MRHTFMDAVYNLARNPSNTIVHNVPYTEFAGSIQSGVRNLQSMMAPPAVAATSAASRTLAASVYIFAGGSNDMRIH